MSVLFVLWLLAAPSQPATPPPAPSLTVAMVVREGLPPYEDDERFYRLEGKGFDQLATGAILLLHRKQERRSLPRLEVTQVFPKYALARIATPGEAFPQRGDQAFPQEKLQALPALPPFETTLASPAAALAPAAPALEAPAPEPGFVSRREPLYFLRGESRLTAAGQVKLKQWVKDWGKARRWSLACPPWPGESLDLSQARLTVLKEELLRLGVARVDVTILMGETPGRLPLLYVTADPW